MDILPTHRALPALVLAICVLAPARAPAQTVREDVKKFVNEELEGEGSKKKKKKKKKKKYKKKGTKKGSSGTGTATGTGTGAEGGEGVVITIGGGQQEGPKLPRRVIGKNLKLDIKAGVGYRGWAPQQYPVVSVTMAHYFSWNVSLKAKLFKWLNISRGYYESNAASNPRKSYTSDAAKYGSYAAKAAWVFAEMGFPILKAWEPTIRYEARAFQTSAKMKGGHEVCIIPYNQSADVEGCTPSSEPMTMISSYETMFVGVKYSPHKDPTAVIHAPKGKIPKFVFGVGYLSYAKPYQVTIGEATLDRYLFTGRFFGGGLAFGALVGGGVNNFFLDFWMQFGLGGIKLTKDMTLNELAPEDWLIGYVQGNATLEYRWALWKFPPTFMIVPSVTASATSFFFFKTAMDEGEEVSTKPVNWDVLWTARINFVLTL